MFMNQSQQSAWNFLLVYQYPTVHMDEAQTFVIHLGIS